MEVIVPDDYLSIAIGKRGQNVRLASKLTGWHLDVQSESRYNEAMKSGYESLMALPDMGVSMADTLYEAGFFSVDEISIASVEDLMQIRDLDEDQARALISAARQAVLDAENAVEVEEKPDMETSEEQVAASEQELPESAEPVADKDEPIHDVDGAEEQDSIPETPAEAEVDSEPKE
jgi:N utilization substance protein A